ncbi:hypothetical protein MRB53_032595 [Persea americana]|uniref:Uncharacterized protein n=1 Tax=Persea americana TaxID=3435 RepID=A0ACC2KSU4_PERAE|nr:hypothetical protein MRB53_032595 [Persea americana]
MAFSMTKLPSDSVLLTSSFNKTLPLGSFFFSFQRWRTHDEREERATKRKKEREGARKENRREERSVAVISLGFVTIHTFSMVIAFNGYAEGRRTVFNLPTT